MTIDKIEFFKGNPTLPASGGGTMIFKDRTIMAVTITGHEVTPESDGPAIFLDEEMDLGPRDDEQKVLAKILRALADRLKEKPEKVSQKE